MSSSAGNVGLLVDRLRDLRRRLVVEGIEEDVMRVMTRMSVLSTVPLLPASDATDWESIFAGEIFRVILPDNSFVAVRYSPRMTILKLKTEVERETGIPREIQVLYLRSSERQLLNSATVAFYELLPDTDVFLVGIGYLVDSEGVFHFESL